MQPSRMYFETDKLRYKPIALEPNKEYTIQFNCSKKSDTNIKFVLGGAEGELKATVGVNHINITTPEELSSDDRLYISGQGNKISDVMLVNGNMKQYPEYFDSIESVGELQENGKYKVNIFTSNSEGDLSYNLSILLDEPLRRIGDVADKIYWDTLEDKYYVERNIGVVVYNGKETWAVQTLSSDYNAVASGFYTSIENAQRTTDPTLVINDSGFICYADAVYSYKPKAIGINRSGRIYLSVYNDEFGYNGTDSSAIKLSLFKEYLSKNPVTVHYLHTTPVIEEVQCKGDVVNLPRLYQKEETSFKVATGNLRSSNITLEYKNNI